MKINQIVLENFGAYEGKTIFDTHCDGEKHIVLIGGKNGAGKTTLFKAMRLCLYGFVSMGHRTYNSHYSKEIIKLINKDAKLKKPAKASVSLNLSIAEGRGVDNYVITRSWVLDSALNETLDVIRNGKQLDAEAIADFEKYIFNIIPPELFNLYFFDGEKIADFFLEDGGTTRIKTAFLTLCGYDTFDIMSKNFKRVSQSTSSENNSARDYIEAQEVFANVSQNCTEVSSKLNECTSNIDLCDAEIRQLDNAYSKGGGITEEKWNEDIATIKLEEKRREEINAWLKKMANEKVPFLMLKDQISRVRDRLDEENEATKYLNFCEVISQPSVCNKISSSQDSINKIVASMKKAAQKLYGKNVNAVFELSNEECVEVLAEIKDIEAFDFDSIANAKKEIKQSLARATRIRKKLEKSSTDSAKNYMSKRNSLLEEKTALLEYQIELEDSLRTLETEVELASSNLAVTKSQLEEELKKVSISDISAKAILMLEDLQNSLYHKQVRLVEENFREEIKLLMRKTHFIDDIHIDDDFGIHIFRYENMDIEMLKEFISDNKDFVNSETFICLKEQLQANDISEVIQLLGITKKKRFNLPIEIDKTVLSNGEKQIFIMALYYALVKLCNHEIPFVIDTPFARIDTEHRNNIAKHFFSKLNGQAFILSTNEEIDERHVKIMKPYIAETYMLENVDNTYTTVLSHKYFGVKQ